jgi:hypothetical protein
MAKAKVQAKPIPAPLSPDEAMAKRAFDAYTRLQSPEMAWVKQFEKDKEALREMVKIGRNAPWSGDGWEVRYVSVKGKRKATCGLDSCLNLGVFNSDELHFKASVMVNPPDAA